MRKISNLELEEYERAFEKIRYILNNAIEYRDYEDMIRQIEKIIIEGDF